MSINFQELRDLLGAISQTDITELVLKNDDFELTVRKDSGLVAVAPTAISPQIMEPVPAPTTPPSAVATPTPEVTAAPAVDDKKWVDITSPMVGTFYSAPAPRRRSFCNSRRSHYKRRYCVHYRSDEVDERD